MNIYFDIDLPPDMELPMEHCSEIETEDWIEVEFNYRLQICDTKIYTVIDKKVVAHLGILDSTIKTVYVSPNYQGRGLTYYLYEAAFEVYKIIYSDDFREPAADIIWEKLRDRHPDKIRYNKKKDKYEYNSSGFEEDCCD